MVYNGKATIENSANRLSILVPSKKNWFALLFGTAWMGGWFFGFISAAGMLGNGAAVGFIGFWLLAWSVGGIAIATMLLWGYFGKEVFTVDRGMVHFERGVFGIGQKKVMESHEVKNVRTEMVDIGMFGNNRWAFWGLGPGKIKFDYGMRTYSFALGVDDAEANHIAAVIKDFLKQ